MRPLHTIKHYLEYLVARLGLWLIHTTPLPVSYAIAKTVSDLAYLFMTKRRNIAIKNILLCNIAKFFKFLLFYPHQC